MPTLDWIGKKAVVNHHRQVPYHLLRCDNSLSCGDPDSGNLLIEGDNLLALKAVLPYYAGQVKCIYIDPPYNTGNEKWVYNDNVNSPEMRKWLGKVVGAEAEDLSRHDKWLCMMYPRLMLLRDFLREDGAIFISIDDSEVHNLRLVANEVFGARNFLCTFVWEKKHTRANDARFVSDNHDFILLYAKSVDNLILNRLPRTEQANERYSNPDNDPRGDWISQPLQVKTPSEAYIYEISTPSGRRISPPTGRSWAFGVDRYKELVRENRIYFGPNGSNVPRMKKFLSEVGDLIPVTIWPRKEVGDNQEAKDELKNILTGLRTSFDNPKPTRLLKRIIQLAADRECLIVDSFAGSGTTGHAVLDLNKQDAGDRRFILVEMEQDVCRNVAAQRLTRVIQGYEKVNGEKALKVEGLGGGFRYCRLDKALFDETGNISSEVKFGDLAAHIFFTETGMPIPKRANGRSPFLGIAKGTAYYLLYNGILGDKRADGGNVLTSKVLARLAGHNGPKVVFGEGCRVGRARLKREGVTFKQIPYEIKVS
ncbi:MAG TPA: site-specific DNA-methyltransferase [Sedimentisphaerales bacterium]|nr:site-specific DNA-methyltransferase [Sedimentisphaerales bacterium]